MCDRKKCSKLRNDNTICYMGDQATNSIKVKQVLEERHIAGMESVIASITGYAGFERTCLINLINKSGAAFVGSLTRSTTHLVCWSFTGAKYELAKRLGTIVVNHRWLEDSWQAGKRLPESPYTVLSGDAVGAVRWTEPRLGLVETFPASSLKKKRHNGKTVAQRTELETEGLPLMLHNHDRDHDGAGGSGKNVHSYEVGDQYMKPDKKSRGEKTRVNTATTLTSENEQDLDNFALREDYSYGRDRKCAVSSNTCKEKPRIEGVTLELHSSSHRHILRESTNVCVRNSDLVFKEDDVWKGATAVSKKKARKLGSRTNVKKGSIEDLLTSHIATKATVKPVVDTSRVSILEKLAEATHSGRIAEDTCFVATNAIVERDNHCESKVNEMSETVHIENESISMSLKEPMIKDKGKTLADDIACVICHTEKISHYEGLLECGHCFCFSCIKQWASESLRKVPTCPLCKAPFNTITRREWFKALKESSQINETYYKDDVVSIGKHSDGSSSDVLQDMVLACIMCGSVDTEELLVRCNRCGKRSAHTFCLDPPLPPIPDTEWFCGRCSQHRRAEDTRWWYLRHAGAL